MSYDLLKSEKLSYWRASVRNTPRHDLEVINLLTITKRTDQANRSQLLTKMFEGRSQIFVVRVIG